MSKLTRLVLVVLLPLSLLTACSREENQKHSESIQTKGSQEVFANLSSTLIRSVPKNAIAVAQFDFGHSAYQKLSESPWGQAGTTSMFSNVEMKDMSFDVLGLLKDVGIDPNNPAATKELISEVVAFLSPGESGGIHDYGFGVIAAEAKSGALTGKIAKLRDALGARNIVVQDLSSKDATGFAFQLPNSTQSSSPSGASPTKATFGYIVSGDGRVAIANSEAVARAVLSNSGNELPTLVEQARFKKITSGTPSDEERYGFIYADLQQGLSIISSLDPSAAKDIKEFPLEGLLLTYAMAQTPESAMRIAYRSGGKYAQWFSALKSSSPSNLVAALPADLMFFLSLDGSTIVEMQKLALAGQPIPPGFGPGIELLGKVKRIGVGARMGTPGQSLLPIPDTLLAFETADSVNVAKEIEQLVNGFGLPLPWADTKVGDRSARFAMSPFGVAVYIAPGDGVVYASTSQQQLAGLFANEKAKTAPLVAAVNDRGRDVLQSGTSVANMYVSFENLASFLESMGGLLNMYAPQQDGNEPALNPEMIANLKRMGTVIGSMQVSDGMIVLQSFYGGAVKKAG